ncbi:DNA adenine methylase [Sulfurimonas sp. HSL-1716]|uniref:DNA adenine methylase n=1 Tax=Hydrocurvibacter sulfurireducens TaxID=3131937 RepID=UPI0031F9B5F2
MCKVTRPPLRYHGGKWKAAPKIIPYFPPHTTYAEPYGGGASVLLRKPRSKNEIYNDLDGDIVNVFRVLRDKEASQELIRLLQFTPFSRDEMILAWDDTEDEIERARRTIVRSQMGFGSAGATKGRTGFRGLDVYENSYSAPAKQFKELPYHLQAIIERLQGVVLENTDGLKIIEQADIESTLFYVDPPYMVHTRSSMKSGAKYYRHEMTDEDHEELLKRILRAKANVLISGYKSDMYMDMLKDWEFVTFESRSSSNKGTTMREECLWIKPSNTQRDLFS